MNETLLNLTAGRVAVMKEFMSGAILQCRLRDPRGPWYAANDPKWNWEHYEYRSRKRLPCDMIMASTPTTASPSYYEKIMAASPLYTPSKAHDSAGIDYWLGDPKSEVIITTPRQEGRSWLDHFIQGAQRHMSTDAIKETKDRIAVMQAFVEGKKVEHRVRGGMWSLTPCGPHWDWHNQEYRIAPEPPEPKYRPYNDEELQGLVGRKLKSKQSRSRDERSLVIATKWSSHSLDGHLGRMHAIVGDMSGDSDWLHQWFTHPDGSPCGVLID